MALSPHQTRRAHYRREERNGRLTRCSISQGITLPADLSRFVGDPPRNVSASRTDISRDGKNATNCNLIPNSWELLLWDEGPIVKGSRGLKIDVIDNHPTPQPIRN